GKFGINTPTMSQFMLPQWLRPRLWPNSWASVAALSNGVPIGLPDWSRNVPSETRRFPPGASATPLLPCDTQHWQHSRLQLLQVLQAQGDPAGAQAAAKECPKMQ